MPENVKYSKRSEAQEYASKVGGHVIAHDTNEDGTPDTWTVVVEEPTKGVDLKDSEKGTPEYQQQEKYLKDVEAAGKPPVVGEHVEENPRIYVDELGYRHGGMTHPKRGPIKYASGGAVRGKRFVGTF